MPSNRGLLLTLAALLLAPASSARALPATAKNQTQTLDTLCSAATLAAALPHGAVPGTTIDPSSLVAHKVTNFSIDTTNALVRHAAGLAFCNVTFAYAHDGRDDRVQVNYFLPSPGEFKHRYLSTGGGGFAINSGATGAQDALNYGAVGGRTDGGFGAFTTSYDVPGVALRANGSLDYDALYMFGYQAHRELLLLGKAFAASAYGLGEDDKVYSYYEGCSEGGREGFSQVQRYGDAFDGALIGAPALRFAQQETLHAVSAVTEQTLGYVPSPCALSAITNATIEACDALDGREDGVVSRVDLCVLHTNVTDLIGTSYSCPASDGLPAQKGKVTKQDAELVQTLYDGLKDSDGRRAYFYFTPSSTFDDAIPTQYKNNSDGSITWEVPTTGLGYAQFFVTPLVEKLNTTQLVPALTNLTYDDLVYYMQQGMQEFYDTLQTTWPDLTPFNQAGGKVIHYHGESDYSIPAYSSVRYWNSVRETMYADKSYNDSVDALGDWYRFFLVPGAGHCAPAATQPNGPFPNATLATLIDWVENGNKPTTLPAAVTSDSKFKGKQELCAFPLRPKWDADGKLSCEYDQKSIETWDVELDAYKVPVY